MKIDKTTTPHPLPRSNAAPRAAGPVEQKPSASAAALEKAAGSSNSNVVQLGGAASAAGSVAATESTFNAARVAEIKQAIADGKFRLNPEKIADGLLDSVREMLDRNKQAA